MVEEKEYPQEFFKVTNEDFDFFCNFLLCDLVSSKIPLKDSYPSD
jgi:hypothetical protein